MGSQIYSHANYDDMMDDTFERCKELGVKKGGEYAGDEDRLANFRRNGLALGLPMEVVWGVYAAKHWDAISQYIKDLKDGRKRDRLESISGRVDDLIVYLILLQCMVDERHNS